MCYLNNFGVHFKGGLFHFENGEPTTVVPTAGDVVMYTADSRNIHSVDEITDGERLTLTLWFTRDVNHDEDVKLLSHLSQNIQPSLHDEPASYIPQPGSTNMYWFSSNQASDQQEGFDICFARLIILGYGIFPSKDERGLCELNTSSDLAEMLMEPLKLIWGDKLLNMEFVNILHALQVVQFYHWKEFVPRESDLECKTIPSLPLSEAQADSVRKMKHVLLKDIRQAEQAFAYPACDRSSQHFFDEVSFSASLSAWEAYSRNLRKQLQTSIPHWKNHQSIFAVPSENAQ